MDWTNNIYTSGAYSLWPKDMSLSDWKMIKSRVGNLFFCGEATSFQQYGYVSGAYLEGIDTAKNIIQCLKKENGNDCPSQYDMTEYDMNDMNDMNDINIVNHTQLQPFNIIIILAFMLIISLFVNITFCVYRIFLIKEQTKFYQKVIQV